MDRLRFGWRIRTPYFEGIHYDLVQGVMWVFFREARRVLRLRIVTDGPAPDAHPGVPILVACRHAGPGDSFTLIHALMHWYDWSRGSCSRTRSPGTR